MLRSNLAVAVIGLAVLVGSAIAAKTCLDFENTISGVNAQGNLDGALPGALQCRRCVNTKNGRLVDKCSGQVTNESGENQKYKNAPEFIGFARTLYKVKASGAAKFTAKAVVTT